MFSFTWEWALKTVLMERSQSHMKKQCFKILYSKHYSNSLDGNLIL